PLLAGGGRAGGPGPDPRDGPPRGPLRSVQRGAARGDRRPGPGADDRGAVEAGAVPPATPRRAGLVHPPRPDPRVPPRPAAARRRGDPRDPALGGRVVRATGRSR